MDLDELFRKELLLLVKHARHDLPWFYRGVPYFSDKPYYVSYQNQPERFVGTHIHFQCDDTSFDRFIPNDDGQTLQNYLAKLLSGKVGHYQGALDTDPKAKGAHSHIYHFYETLADGSLEGTMSYIDFYSISPLEAEALMEVEQMEKAVPDAGVREINKKPQKRV